MGHFTAAQARECGFSTSLITYHAYHEDSLDCAREHQLNPRGPVQGRQAATRLRERYRAAAVAVAQCIIAPSIGIRSGLSLVSTNAPKTIEGVSPAPRAVCTTSSS